MANSGSALLNFGSTPTDTASLAIADTNILTTSLVDAWIAAISTADHSADEHYVENVKVMAGSIVNGVGFTIYGICTLGRTTGNFTVHWVWY